MASRIPSPADETPKLTEYNLSARQAGMGKLPKFSGTPEDWPLFYGLFRYSTKACGFTDCENMLRLHEHLTGEAKQSVRELLIFPATLEEAIKALKQRFGRPELLVGSLLERLRQLPAPKEDQPRTVMNFGFAVSDTCRAIKSLGRREYLNDYQLKQDLVRKLPPTNQLQWFRFVGARTLFHATLDHLSEFLRLIALDISELEPYRPKPGKRNGEGKRSLIEMVMAIRRKSETFD